MKQVLFIRPDTLADGKIAWCVSGQQHVEYLENRDALSTLAEHALATRVCLLLPASEMVFRQFTLPKKSLSAHAAPFSWMAEETLMGDVDALHWTIINKKGRDVDAVAIQTARLEYWLTLCADAGLNVIQVLPDALLLPVSEGGNTLVACDAGWWLRFSPFGACETDSTLLPLLLNNITGDLCCYGEAPAGLTVTEQRPWQHPLVLIQPQWKTCRATMLHGPFLSRKGTGMGARYLKGLLFASVCLSLSVLLGARVAMAWMLVQQENQTQQEIVQVAQHYFPSLRQQSNIKYHFGQNVKKQPKGIFLQLEALEKIKQSTPAVEISQVEYDDAQNQLTLSVSSPDQQALQAFVNQASSQFDFSLQPVSLQAPYTAMITGKYK